MDADVADHEPIYQPEDVEVIGDMVNEDGGDASGTKAADTDEAQSSKKEQDVPKEGLYPLQECL